jgi:hypothetical protein
MLIPLRPIPFYSKRYCQTHDLKYQSEHERVVEYLRALDLEDYFITIHIFSTTILRTFFE